MMKIRNFIYLLFIAMIGLSVFAPNAQAQDKDRMYFLREDGEYSDEDRDEEAQYIYDRCTKSYMYSNFFECACVAGAFRMERDVSDDPQDAVLNRIYNSRQSPCINIVQIAGTMYTECIKTYGNNSRLIRKGIKPDEMCQCYGNEIAQTYAKKPIFKKKYINSLKTKSYVYCSSNPRVSNTLTPPSVAVDAKAQKEDIVETKAEDIKELNNTEESDEKAKSLLPNFDE